MSERPRRKWIIWFARTALLVGAISGVTFGIFSCSSSSCEDDSTCAGTTTSNDSGSNDSGPGDTTKDVTSTDAANDNATSVVDAGSDTGTNDPDANDGAPSCPLEIQPDSRRVQCFTGGITKECPANEWCCDQTDRSCMVNTEALCQVITFPWECEKTSHCTGANICCADIEAEGGISNGDAGIIACGTTTATGSFCQASCQGFGTELCSSSLTCSNVNAKCVPVSVWLKGAAGPITVGACVPK